MGSHYLREQKLKSREHSNPPAPTPPVSFYPFLHPPPSSLLPPSTHQHKRLPSDTPLRSSFLELSPKTHTAHTHTCTYYHSLVAVRKSSYVLNPRQRSRPNGIERKQTAGQTGSQTDRETPFRRVNQAYVRIKKEGEAEGFRGTFCWWTIVYCTVGRSVCVSTVAHLV